VGTSSLRRQCQLLARRPDLEIVSIRGSVETRLNKIETDKLHAVVLAAAGLERLGLGHRISARLPAEEILPAVGQGILAIEIREGDENVSRRIKALEDADARRMALAERAFLGELGGGCQVPIAGHLMRQGEGWWLRGLVARPDGKQVITGDARLASTENDAGFLALGKKLAEQLLSRGADVILKEMGLR